MAKLMTDRDIHVNKIDSTLTIIDYTPEYQAYFEKLNLAWIEKYFEVEEIDYKVLSNPDEYIFKDGGAILMALVGGEVAGTAALKYVDENTFELTKMAVDPDCQGVKIGYKIVVSAIEKAKNLGAKELVLYSQTILVPAIKLYKKLGFKEIPLEPGKYKRCNIKMKISFEEQEIIQSLAKELRDITGDAMVQFKSISEKNWRDKPELTRWSRKEILGHLIDSASNNHQRFVRIQYMDDKNFQGYEQDNWVDIQNYQNLNFTDLINLWYYYNLHLCNVIANLHYDKLYAKCTIEKGETMSFRDLIIGYTEHLRHHVNQILNGFHDSGL